MRLFVITGTHRSGTSVVARIVNLLGVTLGSGDEMLSHQHDNPTGFWEAKEFVDFHDSLLKHLGSTWHEPPLMQDGWQYGDDIAPFVEEARQLLVRKFRGFDHAAFKDPRAASLVHFWQLVEPGARLILTLRNPIEVAESLAERDGFPREKSARIWLDTTLGAFRSDSKAVLVEFDRLFDDLEGAVKDLGGALDLSVADAVAKASSFVDASLRHFEGAGCDLIGAELSLALSVYRLLLDWPRDHVLPLVDALYRGRVAETDVDRTGEALGSANDSLAEALDTVDGLKQELTERAAAYEQQLTEREQHLAAQAISFEDQLKDAASKLSAAVSERRRIGEADIARINELDSEIDRLESALTAAEHRDLAAQAKSLELERSLRLARATESELREEIQAHEEPK